MRLKFFQRNRTEEQKRETWKETHTGISLPIILYIGLKNLKMGKVRSVLTIGGVALGIGIITFLLCIGFGVQKMIVEEVTRNNPENVIDINNGNLENFVLLSDDVSAKIRSIKGVEALETRVNAGGKVFLGESQLDVVIFGAGKEFLDLSRVRYETGEEKFENDSNRVLISERLAKLLGFENPRDSIGKEIKYDIALTKEISSKINEEKIIEGNDTRIAGIVLGEESSNIYVPIKILHDNFDVDLAQGGKVVVSDMEKFLFVKQNLEQMGFIAESINELIKDIDAFFNTVRAILVVFGIIIMSISVMGMLNTLSISLLQRTKEIGILKALGTRRFDVFKMFIIESVIISFIGGLLGFFGGFGLAILVNQLLIYLGERVGVQLTQFVYLPFYFSTAIACFIVFLGLATGVFPAFRAAKIHALEALRYE